MQDLPNIAALDKILDVQPVGSVKWLEAWLQKILVLQVMARDKRLSNPIQKSVCLVAGNLRRDGSSS